jgi:hypothetical protein
MPSACLAVDEIPFCFAETIVGGFLQGFAEKLFSRLQKCNERFEVGRILLAAFFFFQKTHLQFSRQPLFISFSLLLKF